MTSFGVKNNEEVTFSFLRTFGIGEVHVVPAYVFSAQNKTGCVSFAGSALATLCFASCLKKSLFLLKVF